MIHSFWVPELHGKMDLIPTRINQITLESDERGVYRGECAEFCGLQHAQMNFMVVAEGADEFNQWVTTQQQPAGPPADPAAQQGQQVFPRPGACSVTPYAGWTTRASTAAGWTWGPT